MDTSSHPPLDRSGTPATPPPGESDDNHLFLLMMFHFIAAGMLAIMGTIPIIHIVIGVMTLRGSLGPMNQPNAPPAEIFGWLFIGIGAFAVATSWLLAILTVFSGFSLRRRRRYWFSFVVACAMCLWIPIGTVLGVFTIMILMRPSVKARYGIG